jgi:hypothetical protein
MIALLSDTETVSPALNREVLAQAPQALLKLFHLITSTSPSLTVLDLQNNPGHYPGKPSGNELSYFWTFMFL